ncbi:MAG: EAL domain-containing protein [Rhodospirillales bacterium]|nr:EAL domain-containing protein [Rhodospirillales bacterium]
MPDSTHPTAPPPPAPPAPRSAASHAEAERRALRTLWWAIEHCPAAILITDREGRIVYVNPRFSAINGYARTEVLHHNPRFLKADAADPAAHAALWSALSAGEEWRGEVCNRRADGEVYETEVAIAPVKDAGERVSHFIAVYGEPRPPAMAEPAADLAGPTPDVARAAQAGAVVAECGAQADFRALIDAAPHGMIVERDGRPLYANRASAVMFGYRKPAEVVALPSLAVLFAGDDRARVQRYWRAYAGKIPAPKAFECRGVKKDGSVVWLDVRVQSCNLDGAAASLWTIADVTLRKIYEDRLHHQANFDPVTHLPNRWLALDRLVHAIVTGRRRFRKVGVLFIDIDDFKAINDTFGHATGDRFLRQLGERIRLCVREEDTVARIGGDEFTVVLPDLRSVADAELVARKILEAVAAPFSLDGREAFVGASIGITISPEDGVDAETLLGNADAAMYKAKSSGRNQLRFFTPELNARTICRNRAEARLKSALASEELRVLYQPIVSLEGGQIIGAEALLRWHDPELGIVDAEHFIRVAEETGLIVPIGAWTMSMACRDAAKWRRNGRGLFVSVNVCSREFRTKSLAEEVLGGLRQHELPATGLHLEFAENVLMLELPQIVRAMRQLAAAGVRLCIDDFGTGYSSLTSLSRFPLDTVKIDGSLTRRIVTSPVQASLVEAIVAVAHRLGVRVVAEGVETAEQLALLRSCRCDAAQGWLFSEPLTADGIEALLAAPEPRPDPPAHPDGGGQA